MPLVGQLDRLPLHLSLCALPAQVTAGGAASDAALPAFSEPSSQREGLQIQAV